MQYRAAGLMPAALALCGGFLLLGYLASTDRAISMGMLLVLGLQVVCLPLAVRIPRFFSLLFAVSHVVLAIAGIEIGLLVFLSFLLCATVAIHGHWVTASLCAVTVALSIYLDPREGLADVPMIGVIVNSILFITPIVAGTWVRNVLQERAKRAQLWEVGRAELEQTLHDSVAANLSGVVVRLQGLAIQRTSDPALVQELEAIADIARVISSQIRTLLDPRKCGDSRFHRKSVPSLVTQLRSAKEKLEAHGHEVFYSVKIGDNAVDVQELAAIRSVLKEMVTNVIKHSRRDTPVALTVHSTDGQLHLGVRNQYSPGGAREDSRERSTHSRSGRAR